jgi:hypothetical protein
MADTDCWPAISRRDRPETASLGCGQHGRVDRLPATLFPALLTFCQALAMIGGRCRVP